MKEYIDKELFLSSMGLAGDETKYGNRDAEHQSRSYSTYMAYEILDSVDDATAADVVERKRGEWVENDKGDTVCSECGEEGHFEVGWFGKLYHLGKFCHDCGADMREVDHAD